MNSSIEVTTDKEDNNGPKGTPHVSGDKKLTKET